MKSCAPGGATLLYAACPTRGSAQVSPSSGRLRFQSSPRTNSKLRGEQTPARPQWKRESKQKPQRVRTETRAATRSTGLRSGKEHEEARTLALLPLARQPRGGGASSGARLAASRKFQGTPRARKLLFFFCLFRLFPVKTFPRSVSPKNYFIFARFKRITSSTAQGVQLC